jgi:[ribosomal protein S5]-alanine N-acetyltransferase
MQVKLISINISYTKIMHELLSSPSLYTYIPHDPPSLEKLERTYKEWERGGSLDGKEIWLNWVIFNNDTPDAQEAMGHMQVGINQERVATIGYIIGLKYQRRGVASAAIKETLTYLKKENLADVVTAYVDQRNTASINLLKKLNFELVREIKNADFFKGSSSDEFVFQLNL